MSVRFEYLGEDNEYDNAKIWKVEAIHVTTTRNKRKFTEAELRTAGRSLSFRPLNINHDEERQLLFPENATMAMSYNPETLSVSGRIRVTDQSINAQIESGFLKAVSIEQIPTLGEKCDNVICEQHGVAFIGLALLEDGVLPGDPKAEIKIESLLVSDGQRTCTECSDWEACHECMHKDESVGLTPKEAWKQYNESKKKKD